MTNIPAAPILVIENLSIRTATHHLVQNISLSIAKGETVCLIGASGSGKSLTAQAIMGLLPAYFIVEGNILLAGSNVGTLSEEALRRKRSQTMAMVFQDPLGAFNPIQTIGEQIKEVLTIHKVPHKKTHKAQVFHMLEKVQLSPAKEFYSRYPHQLSGGQRQRAMIAMALILKPAILIADEPTSAVDRQTQSDILQLLKTLQQETEMAILLITHDFQVVQAAAQQVIVVNEGAVIESGSTAQILSHAQQTYTQQLVQASICQTEPPLLASESSRIVLNVENATYTYPTKHFFRTTTEAIQNVSFELQAGEFLGIVGTSGSGKSTLAKAIAYLLPSYKGKISLAGREWRSMSRKERKYYRTKVQMIFQDPVHSFNPRRTLGESLLEGPKNQGLAVPHETLVEWLHQVELEESILKRYPHQLSGGQLQRVAIARALSMQPEVLIADEAISALDVLTQHQILQMLQEYCQRSKLGLILITHDIHIAIQYCKRMILMEKGHIVPLESIPENF